METSKKVLFVVRYLWGDEGISIHLIRLAQGLVAQGWQVGLASAIPDTVDNAESVLAKFRACGIQYFYVPFPNKINHPTRLPAFLTALQGLTQVVKQFQPDLLHIHSLSVSPYAHGIRLFCGLPFVSTAHIEPNLKPSSIRLTRFLSQRVPHAFGDRFIAISTAIEKIYTRDLKVQASQVKLIYHGFDSDFFRTPSQQERLKAREQFEVPKEAHVVCLIGRLDPVKGHKILYQALSLLRQQGIEVFAICAGSGGKWEQHIKAQPKDFDVHTLVKFPGFTDARQVLWASDAIVLPSKREGFGLVIAEAMLCGVVPIRTPAAGAEDQIVDGVNGFMMPFDDAEALAAALKKLLIQESLKQSMRKATMEFAAENFSADTMVHKTIDTYLEVARPQ